jgi:hypothetical protein
MGVIFTLKFLKNTKPFLVLNDYKLVNFLNGFFKTLMIDFFILILSQNPQKPHNKVGL